MQGNKYRILVIRFSSLGDIVLTTPLLDTLKENYRNSEIYFLTKRKYQGLFESDPRIYSVIYFDPEGKDKGYSGFFRLIKRLNLERYDLIVDLHSNLRSFFIRHSVKAKKKIRYNKRLIPRLLMVYFKKWKVKSVSTVDSYNKALKKIGIKLHCRIPRLYSKNEDKLWAEKFLREAGAEEEDILIGIAPGAKWETKRWDKDKFSLLAKSLSRNFAIQSGSVKAKIVLVGDKKDQKLIEDIEDYIGEDKTIQAVNLPLNNLMALVERCELFISNDSGPMHLASALGVPTIGIFGPTSPSLGFAPSGLNDKIFWAGVECSPCSLHGKKGCVKESRFCMDKIMPEDMIEEVKKMIDADEVIFLDRDGTLIEDKGFISKIEGIEFIPGAKEGLKILQGSGYKLAIVSNQSGIARGIMTEEEVEKVNKFILEELENEGIKIEGIYFCPHHPEADCNCRKPKTGLIEKALLGNNIRLKSSWVIGDKLSDVLLGRNIKGKSILVLTGYGLNEKQKFQTNSEIYFWQEPDYVARDILDAALYIKSESEKKSVKPTINSSRIKKR